MWRVGEIHLSINLQSTPEEGDPVQISVSRFYGCPKSITPYNPTYRTRLDQARGRQSFGNQSGSVRNNPDEPFTFQLQFGTRYRTNVNLAVWKLEMLFQAQFPLGPDLPFPGGPVVSSFSGSAITSANIIFTGSDPLTGNDYFQSLPLFSDSSETITGNVVITNSAFYIPS